MLCGAPAWPVSLRIRPCSAGRGLHFYRGSELAISAWLLVAALSLRTGVSAVNGMILTWGRDGRGRRLRFF